MTTQPPTQTRWQTRGERLGEISLVLIGFTIPLSTALCTSVFPAVDCCGLSSAESGVLFAGRRGQDR